MNVTALYLPMYRAYVDECVRVDHHHHDINSSNSELRFLSSNMYAVMYNVASRKGHSNIANGLELFNNRFTSECFDGMSASKQEYATIVHDINTWRQQKHVSGDIHDSTISHHLHPLRFMSGR